MVKLAQIQKPKIMHKHPKLIVGEAAEFRSAEGVPANTIFFRYLLELVFMIDPPLRENRGIASKAIQWTLGSKYTSQPYLWEYLTEADVDGGTPRYSGYCTQAQMIEIQYWAGRINWTLGYSSGLYLEAYGEHERLDSAKYTPLEKKWFENLINLYGPAKSDLRIKR